VGYGIKIVGDDDLPSGIEWAFIKTTGGGLLLCLARTSAGSARVLAEAWAAFQKIHRGHQIEQPLMIAV
jgi:hypothetical protein